MTLLRLRDRYVYALEIQSRLEPRRIGMKVNDRVEDFSSVDQDGNAVRLSEMLKSGPLVLFFYPKAMTAG